MAPASIRLPVSAAERNKNDISRLNTATAAFSSMHTDSSAYNSEKHFLLILFPAYGSGRALSILGKRLSLSVRPSVRPSV